MHIPSPVPLSAAVTNAAANSDPLFSLIHGSRALFNGTVRQVPHNNQSSFTWSDFPLLLEYNTEYTQESLSQPFKSSSTAINGTDCNSSSHRLDSSVTERRRHKKHVSFSGIIEIRTHEVILGDHPCCYGLPLGLGWGHKETELIDFDLYESIQPPKRRLSELRLSYGDRVDLLERITGLTEQQLIKQQYEYLSQREKSLKCFLTRGWPKTYSLTALV